MPHNHWPPQGFLGHLWAADPHQTKPTGTSGVPPGLPILVGSRRFCSVHSRWLPECGEGALGAVRPVAAPPHVRYCWRGRSFTSAALSHDASTRAPACRGRCMRETLERPLPSHHPLQRTRPVCTLAHRQDFTILSAALRHEVPHGPIQRNHVLWARLASRRMQSSAPSRTSFWAPAPLHEGAHVALCMSAASG